MRQESFLSTILLPEYLGSSIILHILVLLLVFLVYQQYRSDHAQDARSRPPHPLVQRKEPKVRMRRTPAVPNPVIAQEQESESPALPQVTTPASQPHVKPDKPKPPQKHEELKQPELHVPAQVQEDKPSRPETQQVPMKHRVKGRRTLRNERKKAQHSWYAQAATRCSSLDQKTRCDTTLSITENYAEHYFEARYESTEKSMTPAERVAERFNKEFREAAVNDYVTAVHHALVFSLNRMRIMLAQDEIPALIIMNLTIDAQGNLVDARVSIPQEVHEPRTPVNLSELIRQGIARAAPFRPFPSSIKKPTLDLTINAYPDFDTFAHTGNARTPLVFSIIGTRK